MAGISDQIKYMTVRILTSRNEDTNWTGAGTGFLYLFNKGDVVIPMLITNKHVIEGAVVIGLTFHVTIDDNQTPLAGPGRLISIRSRELLIVGHPDPDVDLAGIALAGIVDHAIRNENWQPYVKCLGIEHIPTPQAVADFGALEDVIMVGYPTGLVDKFNNFPVIRRGLTSTPYVSDYQGKKELLIDIPVFGGSSGSPIFLLNEGSYSNSQGFVVGTRFYLIGVLYAGHTETVNGEIVAQPVPTNLSPVVQVKHMINLGLCIKSALVEDLASMIQLR